MRSYIYRGGYCGWVEEKPDREHITIQVTSKVTGQKTKTLPIAGLSETRWCPITRKFTFANDWTIAEGKVPEIPWQIPGEAKSDISDRERLEGLSKYDLLKELMAPKMDGGVDIMERFLLPATNDSAWLEDMGVACYAAWPDDRGR